MTLFPPRLPSMPLIRRLARDVRGVAAVEFAIILPLMLTLYLGSVELSQGLITTRKSTSVAGSLSDLVAEQSAGTSLTDTEISDIFAAATAIMAPYAATSLKMTVSEAEFVSDTKSATGFDAKIRWTITSNGGTPRPCQTMTASANGSSPSPTTLPSGIYPVSGTTAQTAVIISDVSYTYTPAIGGSLLAWSSTAGSMTFSHTTYMRPRNQSCIAYSGSSATICNACGSG